MQQQQPFNSFNSRAPHSSPRFFGLDLKKSLSFFVFLETFSAILLFSIYLAFFDKIIVGLGGNQISAKALASFFLAIIVYLLWKTCVAAYVTLNFIKNNDYSEISANRYIFVALSLSLGGWWTPFILTLLPNDNVQSSINPRYFITKTYGMISSIGALLAIGAYFLALKTGINSLSNTVIFQSSTLIQGLTISTLVLGLALAGFGFLSIWVWKKEQKTNFDFAQSSTLFKLVSVIWLAIISVELVMVFAFAIIRLIGVLTNIFNAIGQSNRGTSGLGLMMNFVMLPIFMMQITFQVLYTMWVAYVIKQTLTGLWKPHITYRTYESLANYTERSAQRKLKN